MSIPTKVTSLTNVSVLPAFLRVAAVDGAAIDLLPFNGKVVVVVNSGNITAGATNSTFPISLMTGPTTSIGAASAATLDTTITATNVGSLQTAEVDTRKADRYLFARCTITGASDPAFPISISLIGSPQTA